MDVSLSLSLLLAWLQEESRPRGARSPMRHLSPSLSLSAATGAVERHNDVGTSSFQKGHALTCAMSEDNTYQDGEATDQDKHDRRRESRLAWESG